MGNTETRRSQAERSSAMRKRLLKATLESLSEEGYAGTTLSSIVRRAGVSRGAQVHHFASKNELILEAGKYLMWRVYSRLGDVLLNIVEEEERLPALLKATWKDVFENDTSRAFLELINASQSDPNLAKELRALSSNIQASMDAPMQHYFQPQPGTAAGVTDMFTLTILVLSGLSTVRHLSEEPEETTRLLDVWIEVMARQIKARKGVTQPPQKPV